MNDTIYKLIHMIEGNGDKLVNDFNIVINSDGNYEFSPMSEKQLLRFLADIYGKTDTSKLSYAEKTSTAKEVVEYLAGPKRYAIGEYADPENKNSFVYTQKKELFCSSSFFISVRSLFYLFFRI